MAKDTCADLGLKLHSLFDSNRGFLGGRFSALTYCFYGIDFFSFAVNVNVRIHGTMSQLHF